MPQFVHLHLHTQFSLMQGAIRIKKLPVALKKGGYDACAITDHGNMFGAIEFENTLKKHNIHPIIGSGIYMYDNINDTSVNNNTFFQAQLLCQNRLGYQNLIKIVSLAYTDHKRGSTPCVTKELLHQYNKGLICLSGGYLGEIEQSILNGNTNRANQVCDEFKQIFGNRFYLEFQKLGYNNEEQLNSSLIELSKTKDVEMVATNDCHFIEKQEAYAQYILELMGLQRRINDYNLPKMKSEERYLKSHTEMIELFEQYPQSIKNTVYIAEQCQLDLDNNLNYLPRFETPDNIPLDIWLRRETLKGLEERLIYLIEFYGLKDNIDKFRERYITRLNFELDVIISMDFPGYFLIVADFINWSKNNNIAVGPGRGSGAGSLVAYALKITDIDPLNYGLLFERFLNPDRISMPDFDIDFDVNGREAVINYVKKKYGEKNVCQIATFQSLKAKAVVRNVARVLNFAYSDADKIAKLIPNALNITLDEALKQEPQLNNLTIEGTEEEKKLIQISLTLEGLNTHLGTHAAGIIIMDSDITDVMPVCTSKEDALQSMYTMKYAEAQGSVKFDFLGLLNLSIIEETLILVNSKLDAHNAIDIMRIPMDDEKSFKLFCSGATTGVFQLESSGMKKLLLSMQPTVFEDIVAIIALYRPGPLGSGMVDDFVNCKHGRKSVVYPHPLLQDILKETYGVMVYQEQIMQAVQILAGFSLGQSDLLRRAIGKKIPEVLAEQRLKFVEGCCSNESFVNQCSREPNKTANDIFDLIDYFAGYGFNKSHTVAYGLIAYQTAYLKAHYPVQFIAAILNCTINNPEKIVNFIAECKDMGIKVLPPDVNQSQQKFTVATIGYKINIEQLHALNNVIEKSIIDKLITLNNLMFSTLDEFTDAILTLISNEQFNNIKVVLLANFKVEAVRFGLAAIKNAGSTAVDVIIKARQKQINQKFEDFMVFVRAVDLTKVNKRVFETLIKCGAFDTININRAQLMEVLEQAMFLGQEYQKIKDDSQNSLFELLDEKEVNELDTKLHYPSIKNWKNDDLLKLEKEALGFYVSGHPLDIYHSEIKMLSSSSQDLVNEDVQENDNISLIGIITSKAIRLTKNYDRFAIINFEDQRGSLEIPVYPKVYEMHKELIESDQPLLIKGVIKYRQDKPLVVANNIDLLSNVRKNHCKSILIKLDRNNVIAKNISKLKTILQKYQGGKEIYFNVQTNHGSKVTIKLKETIEPVLKLTEDLSDILPISSLNFMYDRADFISTKKQYTYKKHNPKQNYI